MNPTQPLVSDIHVPLERVLKLTEGSAKPAVQGPEKLMEKIWQQATQLGPVLEGILDESHPGPH
jgi:hypothetical protein